jgi:hypothetical protein
MSKKIWLVAALALLASPALAQDDAKAREGLESFLRDAVGGENPMEKVGRDAGIELLNPGCVSFTRPGQFTAAVNSATGDVRFFSRFKPLLYVYSRDAKGTARTAEDRSAEIERRAKFTLEEDVKRAEELLAGHYPAWKERNFTVETKGREDRDALVMDDLVFVEQPREGFAACWPNRVFISVNPETGEIVSWISDDYRVESTASPKLEKEAARAAAVKEFGDKLSPANAAWLEKDASIELVAFEGDDGPRTGWLVGHMFLVDAESGACRLAGRR